jgi:hypothetical protein
MKPYLVDVPVSLNVFVRPNTLSKVFEVVKQARPSTLFLVGDGPRESQPTDKENILKSRKVVEDIDWDCKVYKLYSDVNKGMYKTYFDAQSSIFSIVDRCIFLEDDVLVSVSFFRYCEELLEKYRDDLRVHYISGMNYLGKYSGPNSDYFFSGEGSIWGYATWKRTIELQNLNYRKDEYIMNSIKYLTKIEGKKYYRKVLGYARSDIYEGHVAGPEFYKNLLKYTYSQTFIIPTKNMVSNIGFTEGSIHAPDNINKLPRGIQKLFNMKTYEYEFPLRHPDYVIKDIYYERKVHRILGFGHPLINLYRNVERAFRYLYYGDIKRLFRSILRMLDRKHRYES